MAPFKKSKPKSVRAGGALDSKQRELEEKENKVKAEIDALQRKIAEAPQRAAEERTRSREVMFQASSRKYLLGATMLDTRHVEAAAAAGKLRSSKGRRKPAVLRAERKAAWVQTVALVVGLAFAICWVISHPLDIALLLKWLHLN